MSRLGPRERYEVEIISPDQRLDMDPNGRLRVYWIGDTGFLKRLISDQMPELVPIEPVELAEELRERAKEASSGHRELGEED